MEISTVVPLLTPKQTNSLYSNLVLRETFEGIHEITGLLPAWNSRITSLNVLVEAIAVIAPGLPNDDSFRPDTKDKRVRKRLVLLRPLLSRQFEDVHIDE
jgi:hypothetical protein